jgi:hypothetical protein
MKMTVEEWKKALSRMPAQDLPDYKRCIERLIAELAQQYAQWDEELEVEVSATEGVLQ